MTGMARIEPKLTGDPVATLLMRIAEGDRAAFDELFDSTSPKLFAVLIRLLGRTEAEDALQDMFVKIWRNASSFRGDTGSGLGWMLTLTRHHGIDRLRARGQETEDVTERRDLTAAGPSPEEAALASGTRAGIDFCLGELHPDRADAVRRAYLDGESYAELARRFDVPLNTMRTWLRRSLMALKACLVRLEGGRPDG